MLMSNNPLVNLWSNLIRITFISAKTKYFPAINTRVWYRQLLRYRHRVAELRRDIWDRKSLICHQAMRVNGCQYFICGESPLGGDWCDDVQSAINGVGGGRSNVLSEFECYSSWFRLLRIHNTYRGCPLMGVKYDHSIAIFIR